MSDLIVAVGAECRALKRSLPYPLIPCATVRDSLSLILARHPAAVLLDPRGLSRGDLEVLVHECARMPYRPLICMIGSEYSVDLNLAPRATPRSMAKVLAYRLEELHER